MFQDEEVLEYISTPEVLANEVLKRIYDNKEPSFPIDPFMILRKLNVVYQFRDFKGLEGIYIVPEEEDDIAIVGINKNRPITRQRFTAAHELCHHIKDRNVSTICPINSNTNNPNEKFANSFASALLMPIEYLKREVCKYEKNGYISFEGVLRVAEYFGVSFESCVRKIAYELNMIDGDISYKSLKKRSKAFKPSKKKIDLGIVSSDKELKANLIDSYKFIFDTESESIWYKFKNNFIFNENKVEGCNLNIDEISEIVTDLRVNKQKSKFCSTEFTDVIEVLGHSTMYDYITSTVDNISGFSILNLHRMLYQFAPFPEEGGKTRTSNNYVSEAKFETCDYANIPNEILNIDCMIKDILKCRNKLSISRYIDKAIKIHHKITVVHAFNDGNGRVARAILNWMFRLKDIPPVYVKYTRKKEYYDALQKADIEKDYDDLSIFFYDQAIKSMLELNTIIV